MGTWHLYFAYSSVARFFLTLCKMRPTACPPPTYLSLVQTEEQVRLVSDSVHQDAILDRPEVQLDVQSAAVPSAAARGGGGGGGPPDLVRQQPLLEVVARLDGAEALCGRLHAVRLGEQVGLPPADRQVPDAAGQVGDVRLRQREREVKENQVARMRSKRKKSMFV